MAEVKEYIPKLYMGNRTRVALDTGTETIVEQCHRETNNINKIVDRYHATGMLPPGREGRYEDVSMVGEYHDVLLKMNDALAEYEELPEAIRNRFADAGEFLEFAEQQRIEAAKKEMSPSSPGGPENPEPPPENPPPAEPPKPAENP